MPDDLDFNKVTGEERIRHLISHNAERASDPDSQVRRMPYGEWSNSLIPYLTILSATATLPNPRITYAFTVQPIHLNALGNMHGGCVATLFDFCTSTVTGLVSKPGFWHYLGVSRNLNTSYLRPIPGGTEIIVECEAVAIGKRMAHLRGIIRRAGGDGEVLATCGHDKVNIDPEVTGKL